MEDKDMKRKLNDFPKQVPFNLRKLSGRRHLPNKPKVKVITFKRKYGKATQSFDTWFRSNYGE